ncbi:hypothetical protein F2Q68_00005532 [Brassica cretica]|uniref:Uncharacterized protein n=1 Tax=Brassica cretica TaxID=69181 RepID=A0A8S9JG69_BRACR|nr:hypothetical protein F2Q68_00005532 [Brassica cretica]
MNWSRSWSKFCDSDRIIPNPSRNASRPWCWVGRSVMFLFDCWLAGQFGGVTEVVSEHGFVHASETHDLIGLRLWNLELLGYLGRTVMLLVRIAIRDENLKVKGVRGQTQTQSERGETDSEELDSGMDWTNGEEQDFVGKRLHQYSGKRKIEKDLRNLDKDDIYRKGKIVSWAMSVLWQNKARRQLSDHSSDEI